MAVFTNLSNTLREAIRRAFGSTAAGREAMEIFDKAKGLLVDGAATTLPGDVTVTGNLTLGADVLLTDATRTEFTVTSEVRWNLPVDQASAFRIRGTTGSVLFLDVDTTAAAPAMSVGNNDGVALTVASATGTLGFFGATPVALPSAYTQTYATADKTHAAPTAATLTLADGAGTNDNTIGAITDNASTIAAVQELADEINKLVADVADVKQLVNSVIDDLQALGLVS